MYCDVPQVNQLTSLLLAYGLQHVVVCPGSRNATLVHNFHEAKGRFTLHRVTDERSAAFVALGIALAIQEPVAVCVTSGSALLNCIPAVAEAYYRHVPLLVVSADRPEAWISQLDGQTLPQVGALQPYCTTFAIGQPHTEEDRWRNNRCINEALVSLSLSGGRPAHLNVAIAEPMFSFTTSSLPEERLVERVAPAASSPIPSEWVKKISQARLPVLLVGQYEQGDIRKEVADLQRQDQLLVLPEVISDVPGNHLLEAFDASVGETNSLLPDLVIQIGGNFVHKRFKQVLRKSRCEVIRIGLDESMPDTFSHLVCWVCSPEREALAQMVDQLPKNRTSVRQSRTELENRWTQMVCTMLQSSEEAGGLRMLPVLEQLRSRLLQQQETFTLHLANSSAVRAAGKVFASGQYPILCNRGTNGIEGSLSTAVGYALAMWGLHIVVIGDLSFFYDANALWNVELPDNLRILLLNNGHGGIFDRLPGLEQSPARDEYVAAGNQHFSAEGLASTFHLRYWTAATCQELAEALPAWLAPAERSGLLEVFVKD